MVALGKDVEHYAVLKKFVAEGKETLESARQKAVDLGLDPDGVGTLTVPPGGYGCGFGSTEGGLT
jgi:hypothetical protein